MKVGRFKPRRTAYLAFGHDEEVGGSLGARAMAQLLHSQVEVFFDWCDVDKRGVGLQRRQTVAKSCFVESRSEQKDD